MSSAQSRLLALPAKNYLNAEYGLKSWLLTLDHKRIALLYLFTTIFFFVIGGTAAALIRLERLTPAGDLVPSDTYNKLFSIHGIIMVFFFLVPIAPGVLGNVLIPFMIGAKDVALPRINLFSWYLVAIGGCVELYMMIAGGVDTGWPQSFCLLASISRFSLNSFLVCWACRGVITVTHRSSRFLTFYRRRVHPSLPSAICCPRCIFSGH